MEKNKKTIRILIADDHKIMREGLKSLIDKQGDLEVVGEAENGREAVKLAEKLVPDIVLMDVAMPDLNGAEATKRLLAVQPNLKVLALSMHSDKMFVLNMLKAGAMGYLLKDCAFEELENAIRTVVSKKVYLSPQIAHIVVDDWKCNPEKAGGESVLPLSDREKEILQLLAEGKSTREIAAKLYVSIKTVDTHRRNIMEKLKVKSVAELTKIAIREGLTSLE
ncbi:MAG: response regulator transcription factor [Myxococcota bacterium]